MMRKLWILCTLLLTMAIPASINAQETPEPLEPDTSYLDGIFSNNFVPVNRYAEVPQARTEDGAFVLGNPDAPITIAVFEDFQCPHCQAYETTIQRLILEYVFTGKAKYEFRMLASINQNSFTVFALVECAGTLEGGSFWKARDVMFDMLSTSRFNGETAMLFASRLGLPYQELLECANTARQYETDLALANEIGAKGTPAVFVRYGDGKLQWIRGGAGDSAVYSFEEIALIIDAANPAPQTSASLLNENWLHDTSFITGDPCSAPCWRGITPGVTSWDEAVSIIENDATLADLQIETDEESGATGAVWNEIGGEQCCQMFSEDGETVHSLLLRLAPDVQLGDLIAVYGEPQFVIGSEISETEAVMNVFYSDVAMLVYVRVAGTETGTLSTSSEVVGVLYLSSETMADVINANSLWAWDGYKSYREYEADTFVVTPVPE